MNHDRVIDLEKQLDDAIARAMKHEEVMYNAIVHGQYDELERYVLDALSKI